MTSQTTVDEKTVLHACSGVSVGKLRILLTCVRKTYLAQVCFVTHVWVSHTPHHINAPNLGSFRYQSGMWFYLRTFSACSRDGGRRWSCQCGESDCSSRSWTDGSRRSCCTTFPGDLTPPHQHIAPIGFTTPPPGKIFRNASKAWTFYLSTMLHFQTILKVVELVATTRVLRLKLLIDLEVGKHRVSVSSTSKLHHHDWLDFHSSDCRLDHQILCFPRSGS